MKVFMEKKIAKIDGKEYEYNEFSCRLSLKKVGLNEDYKMILPLESKSEKQLVAQLIDNADFQLRLNKKQDGTTYVSSVIIIKLSNDVIVPVKLRSDSLMLVRVLTDFC